jgi:hypothetical protein
MWVGRVRVQDAGGVAGEQLQESARKVSAPVRTEARLKSGGEGAGVMLGGEGAGGVMGRLAGHGGDTTAPLRRRRAAPPCPAMLAACKLDFQ